MLTTNRIGTSIPRILNCHLIELFAPLYQKGELPEVITRASSGSPSEGHHEKK